MQLVDFTPLEFSSEQTSDELIQGVLLCGNESKNGYSIPSSAFGSEQNVGELYNGTPVFFNHIGPNVRNPMSRNAAEVSGVVRNARLINGRPYGDIEPIDSEQGRLLKSVIRLQPKSYGLSHVARYRMDRSRKSVVAVEKVVSVDVVLNPATTKTFRENVVEEDFYKEQITELRTAVKESETKLATLTQECETLRSNVKELDEANVLLKSEKTELEKELTEFRQAKEKTDRLESLKKLCEESEVPAHAITKPFLESLMAVSEESVEGLIKERAELFTKEEQAPGIVSEPRRKAPKSEGFDVHEALKKVKFV